MTAATGATTLEGSANAPDRRHRWWSLGPRQRSALISWAAFTATFAVVRKMTRAIKEGDSPTGDLTAGGVHVHHYLWGIALLGASGGLAVHGSDRARTHPLVATGYGVGGALVVDEFALLLHLKDVYWTKRGRKSVLLALGLIAGIGSSFTLIPLWRRRTRPRTDTRTDSPTDSQ